MDLWIRNQDRDALVPIKDAITEFSEALFYRGGILGQYKTKERALEVLDEIQKHLEKMGTNEILTDKVGIMNGIKHYGIIYEMPKE